MVFVDPSGEDALFNWAAVRSRKWFRVVMYALAALAPTAVVHGVASSMEMGNELSVDLIFYVLVFTGIAAMAEKLRYERISALPEYQMQQQERMWEDERHRIPIEETPPPLPVSRFLLQALLSVPLWFCYLWLGGVFKEFGLWRGALVLAILFLLTFVGVCVVRLNQIEQRWRVRDAIREKLQGPRSKAYWRRIDDMEERAYGAAAVAEDFRSRRGTAPWRLYFVIALFLMEVRPLRNLIQAPSAFDASFFTAWAILYLLLVQAPAILSLGVHWWAASNKAAGAGKLWWTSYLRQWWARGVYYSDGILAVLLVVRQWNADRSSAGLADAILMTATVWIFGEFIIRRTVYRFTHDGGQIGVWARRLLWYAWPPALIAYMVVTILTVEGVSLSLHQMTASASNSHAPSVYFETLAAVVVTGSILRLIGLRLTQRYRNQAAFRAIEPAEPTVYEVLDPVGESGSAIHLER